MDDTTLEKLRRLGHEIGQAAISHDGKMLVAVDGRLLTHPEIDKLLDDHLKKEGGVGIHGREGERHG